MASTKLTLSMEPEVVYRAKKYAKKKNVSLSRLIQNFLEKEIDNQSLKDDLEANIPEDIQKLVGILSGPDLSKKRLKQMKWEYLKDKYDL